MDRCSPVDMTAFLSLHHRRATPVARSSQFSCQCLFGRDLDHVSDQAGPLGRPTIVSCLPITSMEWPEDRDSCNSPSPCLHTTFDDPDFARLVLCAGKSGDPWANTIVNLQLRSDAGTTILVPSRNTSRDALCMQLYTEHVRVHCASFCGAYARRLRCAELSVFIPSLFKSVINLPSNI